ncbi:NAD(P)H-quinone oxidoreductase subunit I [Citrus sinensis]|uniref:NAD(P)H-quinone oxidoreductase subunit I n=1 Tax=Citrus sinensis TaxID=2711 RepID=A0ACB8JLW9_CITSI|nr:NAD(P)H-quinone oxidoreductase subunit I [Citrus sinensis]
MFPMVTGFMNYGQQTIRAARYIGQSFMITLSQANRLPVTIQYPYEKLIISKHFRVCVRVCPIDLPVVDWKFETDIRKKRLLNYSIDFGICIFCEHELVAYDDHELNYNQIALGNLPILVLDDFTIRIVFNSPQWKNI